jgi:hypothetical protein
MGKVVVVMKEVRTMLILRERMGETIRMAYVRRSWTVYVKEGEKGKVKGVAETRRGGRGWMERLNRKMNE